jgi:type II secretory pathway pseudopilin PulG
MVFLKSEKQAGFTLLDATFATAVVALFFVTLFSLNTQCLFFVNSSRELMSAGQTAQSRLEQIRNLTWSDITNTSTYTSDTTSIQNALNAPVNNSSLSLGSVSERVVINPYPLPSPAPTPIQITRATTGIVTVDKTNSTIANGDMATINVQLTWTAAPGGRSRSISASTIYAKNSQ